MHLVQAQQGPPSTPAGEEFLPDHVRVRRRLVSRIHREGYLTSWGESSIGTMPTPYQVALFLIRLIGAMNVVAGAAGLLGAFLIALSAFVTPFFDGVALYVECWAIGLLISGIAFLLLAQPLARFVGRVF
jgi:hypothetical protein